MHTGIKFNNYYCIVPEGINFRDFANLALGPKSVALQTKPQNVM